MVCGACRSPFCWACMRAKSACGHMKCANGAPYGDFRERHDGALTPPADTPAARAAALVERAGLLTVVVTGIGSGAMLSGAYGAANFSAVRCTALVVACQRCWLLSPLCVRARARVCVACEGTGGDFGVCFVVGDVAGQD